MLTERACQRHEHVAERIYRCTLVYNFLRPHSHFGLWHSQLVDADDGVGDVVSGSQAINQSRRRIHHRLETRQNCITVVKPEVHQSI